MQCNIRSKRGIIRRTRACKGTTQDDRYTTYTNVRATVLKARREQERRMLVVWTTQNHVSEVQLGTQLRGLIRKQLRPNLIVVTKQEIEMSWTLHNRGELGDAKFKEYVCSVLLPTLTIRENYK